MKVLITGGAGFIGSHVADLLVSKDFDVTILDNLSSGSKSNLPANIHLKEADIRDLNLTAWFDQEKFDSVIHLAAQTSVPESLADPYADCDINILGLVNLLEASRKSGVKRFLFASTAAIYGDVTHFPTPEDSPAEPLSFYGLSKWSEECYLKLYQKNFGLDYVILRYSNVYGERQGDLGEGGVISIFTKKLAKNDSITLYGDGEQTRDFIYVKDVAQANYQALLTSGTNQAYNISTGSEISLLKLIDILADLAQVQPNILREPAREGDITKSLLSPSLAKAHLNWTAKTPLEDGLRATLLSLYD